ncbi:MAG: hypothetical protein Q8L15_18145 [Methylobacter sp.]|nr:hypothetical protein [Methylobacter sp.]
MGAGRGIGLSVVDPAVVDATGISDDLRRAVHAFVPSCRDVP